jgi:hypothetical protein
MGEIIGIREEIRPFTFRIWFTVTGEEREVTVDSDKRDLFLSHDITKIRPMACPFLRSLPRGKFACSVHESRPDLCRQYFCFQILVCNSAGKPIGKMRDEGRCISTMDTDLHDLWHREINGVKIPDENHWEEHVARVLNREGYRVVR